VFLLGSVALQHRNRTPGGAHTAGSGRADGLRVEQIP